MTSIPGLLVDDRRHSSVLQSPLAAPRGGMMLHYDDSSRGDWAVAWFHDPRMTQRTTATAAILDHRTYAVRALNSSMSTPLEDTMPDKAPTRDDRIELRTTREEKRLLAAGAAYERLDVTSFIMRNALPAARSIVDHAGRIVLSARDTPRILKLLEKPPKPTAALKAAARRRSARG